MATTKKLRKRPDRSPMRLWEMRKWDLTRWCPLAEDERLEVKVFGNRRDRWYGVRIRGKGPTAAELPNYKDYQDMVAGYRAVLDSERCKRLRGYEATTVPGLFMGPSGDPDFSHGFQVGQGLGMFQVKSEGLSWFKPLIKACAEALAKATE